MRAADEARGRAQQRHEAGAGHVPARVAQEGARGGVAGALVEAPQRLLRPERVQRLRGLAALRFPLLARRDGLRHQQSGERGLVGIGLGRRRTGRRGAGSLQGAVIRAFGDVREHELVAVPRDRAHEGGLARLVAERAPQAAHGLGERAVRDHDVAPHDVQDVAARHRLVPPLDEQDQEVEVARDERHLAARRVRGPAGRARG